MYWQDATVQWGVARKPFVWKIESLSWKLPFCDLFQLTISLLGIFSNVTLQSVSESYKYQHCETGLGGFETESRSGWRAELFRYLKKIVLLYDSCDSVSRADLLFLSLLYSLDHWRQHSDTTIHTHTHTLNTRDFSSDFSQIKCFLFCWSRWDFDLSCLSC